MVRGLGLHVVPLGSNPILTSGQDLFPVVADSTFLGIVNNQLVVLNCVSVKCKLFLSGY